MTFFEGESETGEGEIFRACALTGHRKIGEDFSVGRLREILEKLIGEERAELFYCGMALGFDAVACEMLCDMRDKGEHVRVVACVPCPEQPARFNAAQRERYEKLLSRCDEKIVLSPRYDAGCMHRRNRYMVDRAAYLVAYCSRERGGAASTVRYAQKKGRKIFFV